MPEITKHVETMFSYADLQTTDLEGAKQFYTSLFGWDVVEVPMGDQGVYAMFQKNGKTTAAASLQQEQQRDAGVPPLWNSYFTVYDVDNRTKEAERAGGSIHAEPMDVFDAGRMSVVSDPTGTFFCMWEPKDNIGAEVMNEPDTLTWAECVTSDIDKARAFYTDVFGWEAEKQDAATYGDYVLFKKDGQPVCGLMSLPAEGVPPFFLVYFAVSDCDAAVAKARELRGTIQRETTPIPAVGRFALISDPQGAGFAVLEPEPQSG